MEIEGISIVVKEKMKMEEVDRISALPELLLHHIMSFLPFEQVCQTSILSKTWLRAWHTIPELQFDASFYYYYDGQLGPSRLKAKKLLNFVEQTLRNRHRETIILNKFILRMSVHGIDEEYASYIDRCLCYAVESGVEKLKLKSFPKYSFDELYDLPQLVLRSKSITVLTLWCCKLVLPTQVMILPRLRRLRLCDVYANDNVIKNVIACCLMIEYLSLQSCDGFKNVELFGLEKLHEIELLYNEGLESVKIEATNVQSIRIEGSIELLLISCMNLRCLKLSMDSLTDEWLCYNIPNFHKLEHLAISGANLRSVKISSHCLKKLDIDYSEMLVAVKIKIPYLSLFNYRGRLVSFSVDASNVLESHHIVFTDDSDDKDIEWYQRLVEVLAKFYQFSMVFKLGIDCAESLNIPCELRQILSPPLFGAKHVSVAKVGFGEFAIGNIVDFMLWIAPHAETVSIIIDVYTIRFKFHYLQELICEGESSHCWKSLPVSCWRDCMKEVEIEIINSKLPKGTIVKRYSFKGEGIWELKDGLKDLLKEHIFWLVLKTPWI